MAHLNPEPGPDYLPGKFDLPDNYNVLHISEIHAFEEQPDVREDYVRGVGKQINDYVETYDVDEIHVMGDTGTFDDVYHLLDKLEEGPEVKLVAGDEDKKDADPDNPDKEADEFTGFMTQINSPQPFEVDVEYEIFDEGFETEIRGNTVQAAHHPHREKRDKSLTYLDTRDESILEDLFSVKRYTNEQSTRRTPPSLSGTDIAIYDHVHMPYPRTIGDKILLGLGARRFNYQSRADNMPERSLHLTSFEDDKVHSLHFDAEYDEIFEHEIFDQSEDEVEMYYVMTPRGNTRNSGYLPIQSRFRRDQIVDEAWESEEDMPDMWSQKEFPS
ncbi:MAG: hypothetical protein ABEJ95_01505 [Candidatus Nanohalobium sp.]